MPQDNQEQRICRKESCHTILDATMKGKSCPFHAEQARLAKKRQRDNKKGIQDTSTSSSTLPKSTLPSGARQGIITSQMVDVEWPATSHSHSSDDENGPVKRPKVSSARCLPSLLS